MVEIEYLLEVLAYPDILTSTGIAPQLYFLLKEEAILFLLILLEKSDSHTQLADSATLSSLL